MDKSLNKIIKKFQSLPSPKEFNPRRKWDKAAWQKLSQIIYKTRDPQEFQKLLNILVDPSYKKTIITRAKTIARIHEGLSYRKINEELGTSLQTTSNIKKALSEPEYRGYWKREREVKERIRDHKKAQIRIAKRGALNKPRIRWPKYKRKH